MAPWIDVVPRFLLAVFVNGLWEAAVIAAIAALVLRLLPNSNATTRHTVLVTALFASLIIPVATSAAGEMLRVPIVLHVNASARETIPQQRHATPAKATAVQPVHATHDVPASVTAPQDLPATLAPPRLTLALPQWLAIALVALWIAGALFVLVRLVISLLHLERLKHDALPVPVEYRSALSRWATTTKGSRAVRLCRSPEISVPIAVGLFDAMILVPERLIDELSAEDVDRIVLHELAHLRRGDDWINAVERIAQALFFFNPAIAWLIAQIDLEREVACDDWVLQQNDPAPYASCLAKVAETTMWPYRAMSAPGAFVTRKAMSVRIERLLTRHRDVRVRTLPIPATLAIVAVATLGILAAFITPSIAYTGIAAHDASTMQTTARRAKLPQTVAHRAVQVAPPTAPPAPVTQPGTFATPVAFATPAPTAKPHARVLPSPVVAPTPTPAPLRIAEATKAAYIDELAAAGYTNLSVDDLIQLRSVGVDGSYLQSLKAAGLPRLPVKDLIQLKAVGVDGAFVAAMRQQFGSGIDVNTLVELRSVGVTPAYVKAMQASGSTNMSAKETVEYRATGVTPEYVAAMRSTLGKETTVNEIEEMRAVGVTPEYVSGMVRAGYGNLKPRQIVELRSVGIDPQFVANAAAHGFRNLTVDQLIRLKTSGVL